MKQLFIINEFRVQTSRNKVSVIAFMVGQVKSTVTTLQVAGENVPSNLLKNFFSSGCNIN